MNTMPIGIIISVLAFILLFFITRKKNTEISRVEELSALEDFCNETSKTELKKSQIKEVRLEFFDGRLGRAGCLSQSERTKTILSLTTVSIFSLLLCSLLLGPIIGIASGIYLSALVGVLYLRKAQADFNREIMFQLPLTLESLILLVESGLGILPALERLVSSSCNKGLNNPVLRILNLVYRLAANGIPFSQAAAMVAEKIENRALRHVLLHLDLSRSEGGAIGSCLRSLSDHAHNEWKISVETRVKRLENMVIFPVFASVIGLMILVSAVPLVSIRDFSQRMDISTTRESLKTNSLFSN